MTVGAGQLAVDGYDLAGEMPRRKKTILHRSPDAIALTWALKCSLDFLRQPAIRHVIQAIKAQHGQTMKVVERLGISTAAYYRIVKSVPEIKSAYWENRPEGVSGPVPEELR